MVSSKYLGKGRYYYNLDAVWNKKVVDEACYALSKLLLIHQTMKGVHV